MKRTLLTAVFAALALGVAQAVNIDWTYVDDAQNLSGTKGAETHTMGSYDFGDKIGGATTWAITWSVTLSNYTAPSDVWPVLVGLGDTNNAPRLFISPDGSDIRLTNGEGTLTGGTLASGSQTDYTVGISAANGTYTVVLSKYSETADGVNVYLNGTLIGTITGLQSGGDWQTIRWGAQSDSRNFLDAVASWEVSNLGYITESYETAVLPEPTALALLALGVAGVAFRRRVA